MQEYIENFHYACLQGVYFSQLEVMENHFLLSSDLIDDSYYNYCAKIKANDDAELEDIIGHAKVYFSEKKRNVSLYITPSSTLYCNQKKLNGYTKVYTDAWMVLEKFNFQAKTNVPAQSHVRLIKSKEDFYKFVDTFSLAYGGGNPEDPYANLSPTYKNALENSYFQNSRFKYAHYIAEINNSPVGVATAISYGGITGVYNVGTIDSARNCGVGRNLMEAITKDFLDNQYSKTLFLQTEHLSHVERWYYKMGFKTMFLGECYTL
jgi:GNAT superfamily N-acetyltransferase